jgi:uncharacterized damage-inducible protein DinB
MKQLIINYTKFNLWANSKICYFLSALDEPVIDETLIENLPSMKGLVEQIWDAETTFYNRFTGNTSQNKPRKDFKGDFKELERKFLQQSQNLALYALSLNDNQLNEDFEYSNEKGEKFKTQLYRVILHCVNHSTFLRGQILTIFRSLGYRDYSPIDLETYFKEDK